MTDTAHFWGRDIDFSASGDDLLADGALELEQRILRGLLSNPGDDQFDLTYGAGLGQYVGQALTPEKYAAIQSSIMSVLMAEPDVMKIPLPNITYQADNANSFLSATISYIYAPTGQTKAITAP